MLTTPHLLKLTPTSDADPLRFGARGQTLVHMMAAGFPVPDSYALSVEAVSALATGDDPDLSPLLADWAVGRLMSLRRAPQQRGWGGPSSLLNVGMNDATRDVIAGTLGEAAADDLYLRYVRAYAIKVARLDEEDIDEILVDAMGPRGDDHAAGLRALLAFYRDALDVPFPQSRETQLRTALRAMARAWQSTSARILRQARGAPEDAGLALIVQDMVIGTGHGEAGIGVGQFVNFATGEPGAHGRYHRNSLGFDRDGAEASKLYLGIDARGPSLESEAPEICTRLKSVAADVRQTYREDMQLQFKIQDDEIWLLDAKPAQRSGRGEVALVVRLVEDGLISRDDALLAVSPGALSDMVHRVIDPKAKREEIAHGIAASPGAAGGRIVFSTAVANQFVAQDHPVILVRPETTPEDIRGMQMAQGVLTERGGLTSHAAVIARGLGLPCIVGTNDIHIDLRRRTMTLHDGEVLTEGDEITLDGTTGRVLRGKPALLDPDLTGDFDTFLDWADRRRLLGVRANVDTPSDARLALDFKVDGVGLARTEHMFFEPGRLTAMREMIFAETDSDRQAALDRLLPMQRGDFEQLFEVMSGRPVCIRLLDPPLHEFLPQSDVELRNLAGAMDLPIGQVTDRAHEMAEVNPMLGMRGVRLGLTVPMIYTMQARAIFEAASAVQARTRIDIRPEIMIPLVSGNREVALVKDRVDSIADEVARSTGQKIKYSVGVMVETPRAAFKAGEISEFSEFMSFGTNDLTQMTYGLSRDDAGRFMRDYVNQGIYPEDPFHSLDIDAVGELVMLAVARARAARPEVGLSLCGEHGGDPQSVHFCAMVGLDYVSCSAYRTPIARLAAAQAAILAD